MIDNQYFYRYCLSSEFQTEFLNRCGKRRHRNPVGSLVFVSIPECEVGVVLQPGLVQNRNFEQALQFVAELGDRCSARGDAVDAAGQRQRDDSFELIREASARSPFRLRRFLIRPCGFDFQTSRSQGKLKSGKIFFLSV